MTILTYNDQSSITYDNCDDIDRELTLLQEPYISDSGLEYQAHAMDDNEKEYMVYWDVAYADCEDESDACDWDTYTVNPL